MDFIEEHAVACVAEGVSLDLNGSADTETTLYTVPSGFKFIPLMIILRDFSAAITAAVITAGKTGGDCDEFLGNQTLTNIGASYADEALILQPVPAATPPAALLLDAGEAFGAEITTAEGSALNCSVDVFGKLIAV